MRTPDDGDCTSAEFAGVLQGCRSGMRDAQQRLYELRHHLVYRLAVRIVGREDAADVVQQVFLQLFRKIDQFAGQAKFDTWLYRLAANEALQYLRKRKRWDCETLAHEPVSRHDGTVERNDQQELLERAMGRLESDLRAIFVLKELENLSYREIAAAAGIPEGTVGSRLNRARRELRQHLVDLGWEP